MLPDSTSILNVVPVQFKANMIQIELQKQCEMYIKEKHTEWLINRAMFPISVASITTSSLILKSCN